MQNADRHRNTGPLQHALAQRPPMRLKPRLETAEAEKGFVDRLEFKLGREVGEDAHHASAHIAIQRVIARSHAQDPCVDALAQKVPGLAHAMPSALASFEPAITQPSLLDSTTSGTPRSAG
jgi:hypothetical protein